MANPTTNYSFVLPTSSNLVTDLPADFDVALQGVDTRLKALQPGTTLGDLAYSSATANTNTRLPIGSTNQVLTVSGGVPAWVTPAGGSGTIKQTVTSSYNVDATTTDSSFTDTGLTATITPTSATSKILILITQTFGCRRTDTGQMGAVANLWRNSTQINDDTTMVYGIMSTTGSGVDMWVRSGFTYLDSPASTSALTYKTKWAQRNTCTAYANKNGISYITLLEIGA